MSPLGRTGTYGCVTRTRYKREKGGRRLSELKLLQGRERKEMTEGGRLKKAAGGTERDADSIRG